MIKSHLQLVLNLHQILLKPAVSAPFAEDLAGRTEEKNCISPVSAPLSVNVKPKILPSILDQCHITSFPQLKKKP